MNTADSLGVIRNIEAFTQNFLVWGAALKFYFEPNAKGAGAFVGANFRHEMKVREENGFDETFLEVNGEAPPSEADDLFSLGAIVGYKWLIAGHWIIEPQFAYSRNLVKPKRTQNYVATITLSLGYRF